MFVLLRDSTTATCLTLTGGVAVIGEEKTPHDAEAQQEQLRLERERLRAQREAQEREVRLARREVESYIDAVKAQLHDDGRSIGNKAIMEAAVEEALGFLLNFPESELEQLIATKGRLSSVCDPLLEQALANFNRETLRVEARNKLHDYLDQVEHSMDDPETYGRFDPHSSHKQAVLLALQGARMWAEENDASATAEEFVEKHEKTRSDIAPLLQAMDETLEQDRAQRRQADFVRKQLEVVLENLQNRADTLSRSLSRPSTNASLDVTPTGDEDEKLLVVQDALAGVSEWLTDHPDEPMEVYQEQMTRLQQVSEPIFGQLEQSVLEQQRQTIQDEMRAAEAAGEELKQWVAGVRNELSPTSIVSSRLSEAERERIVNAVTPLENWYLHMGPQSSAAEITSQLRKTQAEVDPLLHALLQQERAEREVARVRDEFSSAFAALHHPFNDRTQMGLADFVSDEDRKLVNAAVEHGRKWFAENKVAMVRADAEAELSLLSQMLQPVLFRATLAKTEVAAQRKAESLRELRNFLESTRAQVQDQDGLGSVMTAEQRSMLTSALDDGWGWMERATTDDKVTPMEVDQQLAHLQDVCVPVLTDLYRKLQKKDKRLLNKQKHKDRRRQLLDEPAASGMLDESVFAPSTAPAGAVADAQNVNATSAPRDHEETVHVYIRKPSLSASDLHANRPMLSSKEGDASKAQSMAVLDGRTPLKAGDVGAVARLPKEDAVVVGKTKYLSVVQSKGIKDAFLACLPLRSSC